jgi:hypothetical protein
VDVARTRDEFIAAVERAWRQPDAALIGRGIERAAGSSWDATVESMRHDVQQALWARVPAQAAA